MTLSSLTPISRSFRARTTRGSGRAFTAVALGLTSLLTACIGPHSRPAPVPPSQDVSARQVERPAEPTVAEQATQEGPAPPAAPPLSLPPVGLARSAKAQEEGEVPVVEAKPVLVTAQRESTGPIEPRPPRRPIRLCTKRR